MKLSLQASLCFVFVAAVSGQGYIGRQRKTVVHNPKPILQKPPYTTDPGVFDPNNGLGGMQGGGMGAVPFNNGLGSARGGGMGAMPFNNGLGSVRGGGIPDHIRRIIGSTITGNAMVGGMNGLPRHGGTLNENGLVNGWGAQPTEQISPALSTWNDPLGGAAFPTDYSGQELVFDPRTNRYVVNKGASIGQESHRGGFINPMGGNGGNIDPMGGVGGNINPMGGVGGNINSMGGVSGFLNPMGGVGGNINTMGGVGGNINSMGGASGFLNPMGGVGGRRFGNSGAGMDIFGQGRRTRG